MPTKRIEVIERAAATLRAQLIADTSADAVHSDHLRVILGIELQPCPSDDVMLGGAYSRLQLWAWENPRLGGAIWLSADLDPELRRFAIAHELGHYMLHRGEGIRLFAPCDERAVNQQTDAAALRSEDRVVEEYSPRVRREQEANAFAAELLAPRAEVRRIFTSGSAIGAAQLALHFGISHLLARRRLIDAVLAPERPTDGISAPAPSQEANSGEAHAPGELIAQLDDGQRLAARAPGPALVVAGPGTGKTATLVGRAAHLIEERHIQPEEVLALTFSNRAAGEMRERLERSGLPGERMPIMTIHAFAATLLREYASQAPHTPDEAELTADFRILDEPNAFLLMEGLLGELPLHYYRSLGNPTAHLRTLLDDFSHARDELLTPMDYLALVDAMPRMPAPDASTEIESPGSARKRQSRKIQPPDGAFTDEQIARARERAAAYAVWDRALRRRGLVDFGGLIQRAVELLRANRAVLAHVRGRYSQILVDEFQDTNRAAAELLLLIAGDAGGGLWVVGDQNQSIYRFRGASPGNLPRLAERYPNLRVLRLRRCYRAVPGIVRLGSAMATQLARLAPTSLSPVPSTGALHEALQPLDLEPARGDGAHQPILRTETFASAAHERVGLAAAIERFHVHDYRYGDQAILCRTHKQARQIAAILTRRGVPVSQLGDFFERSEVKDALMLLTLAAGPDARGVLRSAPLLVALGCSAPAGNELAATARYLSIQQRALPGALRDGHMLGQIPPLAPTTRAGLVRLGEIATGLRNSSFVGAKLADFLLLSGGYAWRLARVADGQDAPQRQDALPGLETAGQASQALAALGELVRLAWRFDARWQAEPEFRARLSRAVRHRKAARAAQPDTLAPAPNADVMPSAAPASAQPDEAVPVVTCFLHYLRALRATDVAVPVPAGNEDAVHILTLHQSKGLEFPVVLLPNLAHGQFPAGRPGREEIAPPGFRDGDTPGERDAEERCLFYVGVTRARDIVAFSRAASYSNGRTAERSSLLALMDGAPGWEAAEPLLSDEECERLLAVAATFEETNDDEEDESESDGSFAAAPVSERTPAQSPREKPVFRLHDLNQYLECPLQYKYLRIHDFRDPAREAVYSFHAFIRQGARTLRDVQAASPGADWKAAEARLQPLWDEVGPAGHAYEDFYRQAAEAILREEWRAITSPEGVAASERVRLAQPLQADLKHCVVEVTADREIDGSISSGEGAAPLTILVRLHTGRPRDAHKDDLTLPLYYLAYQQQHPGVPVRIVLAYTSGTLDDASADSADSADSYDPRHQRDVTDEARKAAERYLDPERKSRSKLDKLDEAARGIVAGAFAPRPNERRCAACAFCYVCPSDPESADPSPIPAATSN